MNQHGTYDRFEELEAGRLLGDLDEQEWNEWRELSERFAGQRDSSLECVAAALEVDGVRERNPSLPEGLARRLRADAEAFAAQGEGGPRAFSPDRVAERRVPSVFRSPRFAWGIAALLAALLVAVFFTRPAGPGTPPSNVVEAAALEERAGDLVTPVFSGVEAYAGMSGRVVWSDQLQEGYMELTNLEVNDPTQHQYQLWIVDPSRSAQPVDGGVFNVDSSGTVRVPIDAKLEVHQPQAFVITLEKPGGVVVSAQETVVAISKVEA